MRIRPWQWMVIVAVLLPVAAVVWQQGASEPLPKPPHRAARRSRPAGTTAPPPKTAAKPKPAQKPKPAPLPPPERLANPPAIVRAVYFTEYSAGLKRRVDYLAKLHDTTEINAVVFDVKDYSGYVCYRTAAPLAREYGAVRPTVRDIDALVRRLHAEGIYVIARLTCFQDPVLARARPDLAVHRLSKLPNDKDRRAKLAVDSLWLDRKGLAWIDPASRPAWDYIAAIGQDALAHGIDELNFDYIRFPSDGNMRDMYYPHWDGKTPKHKMVARFFEYLRKRFADVPISADLFGLSTVNADDLGIGQVIEDAYEAFDYVCPMVYPSHYARAFLGFPNPAKHPYEVVDYSMREALRRLVEFRQPNAAAGGAPPPPPRRAARLRPWIQDFNLGASYNADMVRSEITAVHDALGKDFAGYMVWSPSNVYTRAALKAVAPVALKPVAQP